MTSARALHLRRRIVAILVMLAVLAGAAWAVVWFTPAVSLRSVVVEGVTGNEENAVRDAAGLALGVPVPRTDVDGAAQRVAALVTVESVTVRRELPSTVRITVTPRTAVAWVKGPDGRAYLLDRAAVNFVAQWQQPKGLLRLDVRHPFPGDAAALAALGVIAALPVDIRKDVESVGADTPGGVTLRLTRDRTVVWGADADNAAKAQTLKYVLTKPAREYNVMAPDFPTYK